MDGQGAGSCVMFGSAPSCPSFSVSPSVKLSVAGHGGAGKGGSCVLILDLVVMVKAPLNVGGIVSEMEEMFRGGDMSTHRSSWYWTYSSILIYPSSSMLLESMILPVCSGGMVIRFSKPEDVGRECSCKVLGGIGGLGSVLLDEDTSSSKRFLPPIARESFGCDYKRSSPKPSKFSFGFVERFR
ncbi:hypothetical protein Tco_1183218 [Tanacetum coccineum]